jgi:hypothetical protein
VNEAERIERLEHRVRELQTAVLTMVRELDLVESVASAERARLDEVRFRGERPDERLLELYGAGEQPA